MQNLFTRAAAGAPAPRPQANPFAQTDPTKSIANTFDLNKAAGPMQGASVVSVSDEMLASKQLGSILAKDNPLLVQARTRAQEAAAARGLGNSSIAIGAGQAAMNDVALPLAQQDAGTFFDAAKFNASESNNFARDANNFGRQGALQRFGALVDIEGRNQQYGFESFERGQDRDLTRSESALDRNFRRDERLGVQDFQAGESLLERASRENQARLDREQQTAMQGRDFDFRGTQAGLDRDFSRTENQAGRDFARTEREAGQAWQSGENQVGRQFTTSEREASQRFSQLMQAQSQEFQAAQQQLQNEFARSMQQSGLSDQMLGNFASNMQSQIGAIMSDPNMTPEQKTSAMENYYAYANSQMSWMANFFGRSMPNMRTGAMISPTGAPAPVPTPAPADIVVGNQPPATGYVGPVAPIFNGGAPNVPTPNVGVGGAYFDEAMGRWVNRSTANNFA